MGNALLFSPGFHAGGNLVGHAALYAGSIFHRVHQALISLITQELTGRFRAEYIAGKKAGNLLTVVVADFFFFGVQLIQCRKAKA